MDISYLIGLAGIVLLFLFLFAGMPIFVAFGLGGIIIVLWSAGFPMVNLGNTFFNSISSFSLVAIPLFILAGELLLRMGASQHLINLLKSFFGHLPGSLAVSSVAACAFFGALTGSSAATLTAIGVIMIPAMLAEGYPESLAAGTIACSAPLGNLIPPSIILIVYGSVMQMSVSQLFAASFFPGIVATICLMGAAVIIFKKQKLPTLPKASWRERGSNFIKAIPALLMPIIILGGIYGGIFTPTEAAAVACLYVIIISFTIYHTPDSLSSLWKALSESVVMSCVIGAMIIGALISGKMFGYLGIPQAFTHLSIAMKLSPIGFLLFGLMIIIMLGCFMDNFPILFIVIPILVHAGKELNIDPLYMAMVWFVGLEFGQITPPVGMSLYVASAISKIRLETVMRGAVPFILALLVAAAFRIFIPQLSLWLPQALR